MPTINTCDNWKGSTQKSMLTRLSGTRDSNIHNRNAEPWKLVETQCKLEINKVSALNLLRPIKYSITHKHTFAKANNDHAAPPLKMPKGHLIGQWM